LKGTFRSLEGYNYRVWATGALVSNVGSWMQRTAQDWIVLTELTDRNATAMGIVMGLQFGPQILLLPLTGFVADHLDRRKVLFCTQAAMGLLALGLGLLVVTGLVQLWHVSCSRFCWEVLRPLIRRRGRPSSPNWSRSACFPTPWRSTRRRSMPPG
jgi:MFS family permease